MSDWPTADLHPGRTYRVKCEGSDEGGVVEFEAVFERARVEGGGAWLIFGNGVRLYPMGQYITIAEIRRPRKGGRNGRR